MQFLDESKNPLVDLTGEVVAEGGEHQIYYEAASGSITFNNLNTDAGGLPLGTASRWITGTVGTNSIRITLIHKPASQFGAKTANDPVTKGETDVQVTFPVKIQ